MLRNLAGRAERRLFRSLNAVVEPVVRAGLAGPVTRWTPGPVVLETLGRHSGLVRRAPLLSQRLGDVVVVGTARGERSQWLRNLEAQPDTHVWVDGHRRRATASLRGLPGLDVAVLHLYPAS
jgi:F420H(2)-dependent quinone reductase